MLIVQSAPCVLSEGAGVLSRGDNFILKFTPSLVDGTNGDGFCCPGSSVRSRLRGSDELRYSVLVGTDGGNRLSDGKIEVFA
jgi:hypothetical protein